MAIITISREMGTGAYQIAKEVARKLKYTLVDGAKVAELAPEYGLTAEIIERIDEKPPSYNTAEDRLQAAYLTTMELMFLEKAKKGNVILYGRGGQDLLKEIRSILRVRFIAPFDERVEMFAEREWIDPDLASDLIRKNDHQRGGYLHFYYNRDWNDPLGYDLTFNTSRLSPASMVESIVAAAKDPRFKDTEAEALDLLEDIILSKRVETELLKSDKVKNLHFKITSQDGVIALTGHVYDDTEKNHAIRIAGKIKGVQKVVDNLQIMNFKPYKEQ